MGCPPACAAGRPHSKRYPLDSFEGISMKRDWCLVSAILFTAFVLSFFQVESLSADQRTCEIQGELMKGPGGPGVKSWGGPNSYDCAIKNEGWEKVSCAMSTSSVESELEVLRAPLRKGNSR